MKHIKKFGKFYHIISTKDLAQSLTDIKCPKIIANDIIKTMKRNNNFFVHEYAYIGTNNNWSGHNDWDWMSLIHQTDDYGEVDGNYIYEDECYTFMGYDNLTSAQKAQVLDIKQELLAKKDAIKYNL